MSKDFFYAIKSTDFLSSCKNIAWQNYGMLCENISVIHSVEKLSDNRQQKSVNTNNVYQVFKFWYFTDFFMLLHFKNRIEVIDVSTLLIFLNEIFYIWQICLWQSLLTCRMNGVNSRRFLMKYDMSVNSHSQGWRKIHSDQFNEFHSFFLLIPTKPCGIGPVPEISFWKNLIRIIHIIFWVFFKINAWNT